MPRRKKTDLNALADSFILQIEARFSQLLKQELGEVQMRLDRIEHALASRDSRDKAERAYKICSKSGCPSRVVAHGLCSRHYQQWRYYKKKAERQAAREPKNDLQPDSSAEIKHPHAKRRQKQVPGEK